MRELLTNHQMKAYDSHTIQNMKVPSCVLMEKAALRTADAIEELVKYSKNEKIIVICGSGNNGGDGIAIARILYLLGYAAEIFLAGNPDKMTEETKRQWEIAKLYKVPFVNILHESEYRKYTTIVDAIFGVGLERSIEGRYFEIITSMNKAKAKKVAVDIPSGIHGDTGQVMGIAFDADLTVTFAYKKRGLCLYPGRTYAGKIITAEIGIYAPENTCANAWYLEKQDLKHIPQRAPDGNKGTFGKVLAIAGSTGMCGAAYLCAKAALKTGAGMVKIHTEETNRIPLQTLLPEAMISVESSEAQWRRDFEWCDVLILGPGLGTSEESADKVQWFLKEAKENRKPVVLDADGLNLFSKHPKWKEYLESFMILTPHMGEMSRLTGDSISEIKKDPAKCASAFAAENGAVLVLKDACTITAASDGRLYFNLSGNAGMATAGSGDVLAGITAALYAIYRNHTEIAPVEIAAQAVFLHGLAGDLAAENNGQRGMTAEDIISCIPEVLKEFEE